LDKKISSDKSKNTGQTLIQFHIALYLSQFCNLPRQRVHLSYSWAAGSTYVLPRTKFI